jgi:PAS domain S-box-containing protein
MITILVVDQSLDCEGNLRSLWADLPADQFHVEWGLGYRAILEGFRRDTADVCVIDSSAGNGLRVLSQARSTGSTMPILMVTSNDASEVIEAMRSGASGCLLRSELTRASIERSICCGVEQARSATLQSERARRYLALFDNADEIIYTHDLNNNLTSMNEAGLQLLGYSLPELSRLKVSSIVDTASQALVSRTIDLLLDAQTRTLNKVRLAAKSGQSFAVEMNAHPIYRQGKPVEIQVIARPIDQRRSLHADRLATANYPLVAARPYRLPASWPAEIRAV